LIKKNIYDLIFKKSFSSKISNFSHISEIPAARKNLDFFFLISQDTLFILIVNFDENLFSKDTLKKHLKKN
jgi:hypothetical protein